MADILAIGELLIDFTAITEKNGDIYYKQNAGGAPANVVCMAAKLGASTGFIGKIGKDMFGNYLKGILEERKVDTRGLILDKDFSTTLAFVKNGSHGERDFVFYRRNSADLNMKFSEVNLKLIDECKIFHFGALSLTAEPSKSATIRSWASSLNSDTRITIPPSTLWKNLSGQR